MASEEEITKAHSYRFKLRVDAEVYVKIDWARIRAFFIEYPDATLDEFIMSMKSIQESDDEIVKIYSVVEE